MSLHNSRPCGLLLLVIILNNVSHAQQVDHAQSAALGSIGLFTTSPFASYHNPSIAMDRGSGIGLSAFNRFGLGMYTGILLCGDVLLDKGRLGFATSLEPLSGLSLQHIKLSFAKKLNPGFSMAVSCDAIRHITRNRNHKTIYTFGIYTCIPLNKAVELASLIFNPLQPVLTPSPKERSLAQYQVGVKLTESERLEFYAQWGIQSGEPLAWSLGVALQHGKYQWLAGLQDLHHISGGVRWKYREVYWEVSLQYHPQLAASPNLSVWYAN